MYVLDTRTSPQRSCSSTAGEIQIAVIDVRYTGATTSTTAAAHLVRRILDLETGLERRNSAVF